MVQGGLCPGGLCPGGSVSVQEGVSLSRVFSVQGVLCPGCSLSRVFCVQGGLCPGGGFLSRGISLLEVSVQGVLCPGASLSRGYMSGTKCQDVVETFLLFCKHLCTVAFGIRSLKTVPAGDRMHS